MSEDRAWIAPDHRGGGWKVGDRCKLAHPKYGKVWSGTIEAATTSELQVRTDDGKLWRVRHDSGTGFVTRP